MNADDLLAQLLVPGAPGLRSSLRVAPGVWHLDVGADDRVFVVAVQEVPRHRLAVDPPVAAGTVDGLLVELVAVVVDTAVTVQLAAAPGARRDELVREHEAAFQRWSQDPGQDLPDDPATRLVRVRVAVSDDVGTAYAFPSGQAGRDGDALEAEVAHRPAPPPEARRLVVTLTAPDAAPVRVELDLPEH